MLSVAGARLNADVALLLGAFSASRPRSTNPRAGSRKLRMISASVNSRFLNAGTLVRNQVRIAATARFTQPIVGVFCAISAKTSSAAIRRSRSLLVSSPYSSALASTSALRMFASSASSGFNVLPNAPRRPW